MGFSLRRGLHLLARIGRPLLRLLNISDKTVAGKVAGAAEILDPLIPRDEPPTTQRKVPPPPDL